MNSLKGILAIVLFCAIAFVLQAQVSVEKSDKQIIILGKKYYIHEVRKGQTPYSISRAYQVSETELVAENPEIMHGLRAGTEIKIPVKDGSSPQISNTSNDFIYHKVEKKQTLYFLSNKYNISEAELLKYNPELVHGTKTGQVLKIPRPGTVVPDENSGYRLHTVQPGETVFSLSQKYGIEINDLRIENPELKNQGPRIGQVLRIPIIKKSFQEVLKINQDVVSATGSLNYDPLYFEEAGSSPCSEFKYRSNMIFKVAVLLPLFINENYASRTSGKYFRDLGRFYEFYNGLLLAAKRMKESGVSVEFYVKDTKGSTAAFKQILEDTKLKEVDLIIGPVYSEVFKMASDFARENRINIVAPFTQKYEDLVVSNPYMFLANPGQETDIANISNFIAGTPGRSVIVLHTGKDEELKIAELFKTKLVSSYSPHQQVKEIVYKQVNYLTGGQAALENALSLGLENVIVVPSSDMVFLTNLTTRLNFLASKYRFMVVGLRPWEQYESVELDYLKNIQFHYGTTSYVDRNDEKVKLFDYQYKAYFKDEASIFSYLGFDIGYYFLNVLKDYGRHFQFCMNSQDKKPYKQGLRFDFNFQRVSPYSGFENNWLRIVKVDKDLQVVKVK
jgi:LysM repeat protein